MKYFTAMLLLIIWMILTCLLPLTLLGIIVVLDSDSGWMIFPQKLLKVFD